MGSQEGHHFCSPAYEFWGMSWLPLTPVLYYKCSLHRTSGCCSCCCPGWCQGISNYHCANMSTGQFCFAGWGLTIQFSHPHSILPNWVVGFFEQWHVNILSVPFPFTKGDKKAHVFEQVPPVPCHLALISPCIQCGHDCSLLVICKYCSKLTVYLFLLRCQRNHFRHIKRLGFDLYTSTWICSTVPIGQCGLLPNIPRLLSSRVPMEHSQVQPLSCT